MATPREKRLPVDVESLTTALSRLCVSKVAVDSTPRSTNSWRRGRLRAKRALFPDRDSESVPVETARPSAAQLDSKSQRLPVWSETEKQALVNFLLLYTDGCFWSSLAGKGDIQFWENAGAYVQKVVDSEYRRTGGIYTYKFQYVLHFYRQYVYSCVCTEDEQ